MDLIKIKYEPVQVPHSQTKRLTFSLQACTIPQLEKQIASKVEALKASGLDRYLLEFQVCQQDGEPYPVCTVFGTRLETDEEMQARIKRQEAYNARQIADHKARLENSQRLKEIKRLTEHLTLDQLKALEKLK